jgi:uncharacterized protein YgiM (DUF1202 family)
LDNFREWLSDNLRYFMLGGGILIIVAVLFFGIRAFVGVRKGITKEEQTTAQVDDQGNDPSSPEIDGETNDEKKESTNPLEQNNAEITALIQKYYEALGEKDTDTIKTLTVDFDPSDEARIANAKYIQRYEVTDVYSKKGLDDSSYAVYACFNYYCEGIETPVPALSQIYVVTDSSGELKIDAGAEQDEEISAYMDERLQQDEDVMQLYSDVKAKYEEAQETDADLAAFLAGLGEDAGSSVNVADGTMLTATEDCNVRAAADSDAEIIGGLASGTQVEKLGEDGEWIEIEYEGETGYVYGGLLE